jgi:hypothetical protein
MPSRVWVTVTVDPKTGAEVVATDHAAGAVPVADGISRSRNNMPPLPFSRTTGSAAAVSASPTTYSDEAQAEETGTRTSTSSSGYRNKRPHPNDSASGSNISQYQHNNIKRNRNDNNNDFSTLKEALWDFRQRQSHSKQSEIGNKKDNGSLGRHTIPSPFNRKEHQKGTNISSSVSNAKSDERHQSAKRTRSDIYAAEDDMSTGSSMTTRETRNSHGLARKRDTRTHHNKATTSSSPVVSILAVVHSIQYDPIRQSATLLLSDDSLQDDQMTLEQATDNIAQTTSTSAFKVAGALVNIIVPSTKYPTRQGKEAFNKPLCVVKLAAYKRRDIIQDIFEGNIQRGDVVLFHNVSVDKLYADAPTESEEDDGASHPPTSDMSRSICSTMPPCVVAQFKLRPIDVVHDTDVLKRMIQCGARSKENGNGEPLQYKRASRLGLDISPGALHHSKHLSVTPITGSARKRLFEDEATIQGQHLVQWYNDEFADRPPAAQSAATPIFPTLSSCKKRRLNEIDSTHMLSDIVVTVQCYTRDCSNQPGTKFLNINKWGKKETAFSMSIVMDGPRAEDHAVLLWHRNTSKGSVEAQISAVMERQNNRGRDSQARVLLRAVLSLNGASILSSDHWPRSRKLHLGNGLTSFLRNNHSQGIVLMPTCGTTVVELSVGGKNGDAPARSPVAAADSQQLNTQMPIRMTHSQSQAGAPPAMCKGGSESQHPSFSLPDLLAVGSSKIQQTLQDPDTAQPKDDVPITFTASLCDILWIESSSLLATSTSKSQQKREKKKQAMSFIEQCFGLNHQGRRCWNADDFVQTFCIQPPNPDKDHGLAIELIDCMLELNVDNTVFTNNTAFEKQGILFASSKIVRLLVGDLQAQEMIRLDPAAAVTTSIPSSISSPILPQANGMGRLAFEMLKALISEQMDLTWTATLVGKSPNNNTACFRSGEYSRESNEKICVISHVVVDVKLPIL